MPTDAELRIADPDGLATDAQLEWIAEQFERFTALTGPDRMGLDEIRVVPGRYEEGMTDFVFGQYIRRGGVRRVELTEEILLGRNETFLRHELCHALDDAEGISDAHAELMDPEENQDVSWGYHVPDDHPEMEIFALLCDDGPPAIYDIYGDASCSLGLDARSYVLHDAVYQGRPDLPTAPGPEPRASVSWWGPLLQGMSPVMWVPVEGGLLQLLWMEVDEGWELKLLAVQDGAFTPHALPEPWDTEALRLWPGLDGRAWLVRRDAIAPIGVDGAVGAELPIAEELATSATHAVVLDQTRILAIRTVEQGGPGHSIIHDREAGAALLELERIHEDQDGFTLLDGEVWVPSGDLARAGLYRLTEQGWSYRPGPHGSREIIRHQGELVQRWGPDYWLDEQGQVGGLAVLHGDGSWTPLGASPCELGVLPGRLIDTGEQLLVYDAVEQRLGELDLSW